MRNPAIVVSGEAGLEFTKQRGGVVQAREFARSEVGGGKGVKVLEETGRACRVARRRARKRAAGHCRHSMGIA